MVYLVVFVSRGLYICAYDRTVPNFSGFNSLGMSFFYFSKVTWKYHAWDARVYEGARTEY